MYLGLCSPRESIIFQIIGIEWPLFILCPQDIAGINNFAKATNLGANPYSEGNHFHGGSIPRTQVFTVHLIRALNNLDVRNPFVPLAFMVNFYIFSPSPHFN